MSEHAKYSPSSAEKWATCHGAIALEATLPPEKEGGIYKDEGTRAHSALEQALSFGIEALEACQAVTVETDDPYEMAEAVEVAVNYVNERVRETGCQVMLEQKLVMSDDWWGTADVILVGDDWIEVVDYKHGRGVLVEIENNYQLQSYGIGAYMGIKTVNELQGVKTTIVQPRIPHPDGLVRSYSYTVEDLTRQYNRFMDAIEAIEAGNTDLKPTAHSCQWCRAKGICPALHEKALQDAQTWFPEEEVLPTVQSIEEHAIVAPSALTMEQRVIVLKNVELIRAFLKAIEAHSLEVALEGTKIPGFKVVEGTGGQRKFTSEDDAAKKMKGMKIPVGDYTVKKMLGPAPVEKMLKKRVKEKKISEVQMKNVMALVKKPPGKRTLVPESDKRPNLIESPDEMFEDVPPTEEGDK